MNMDKIPLEMAEPSPGEEYFRVGTLEISKAEAANAEKINQLIDWCRELQEELFKVKGK